MMRKDERLDDATEDLAYRVIGAAIEVHKELGPGLLESIYENALCIEFSRKGIAYERQKHLAVRYKGLEVGHHILDILVDDCIILELKATEKIAPVHTAQLLSY